MGKDGLERHIKGLLESSRREMTVVWTRVRTEEKETSGLVCDIFWR